MRPVTSSNGVSENEQWRGEIVRLRAENEWMRAELKKVADLIASDASKRP